MDTQETIAPLVSPGIEPIVFESKPSLGLTRRFSKANVDPYSLIEWEMRTCEIKNSKTGEIVFFAENLEFPKSWSLNASDIVADKYFRFVEQTDGTKKRETSVKQMIDRVANTIVKWGLHFGYFDNNKQEANIFCDELKYLLVTQQFSFNSPVWFNLGTHQGRLREEQMSACFIVGLEDTMTSILELGVTEGRLYKGGSGSGVNYSKLRSSREKLSGGGTSSGPVPFIFKDDCNAGSIKSGGSSRRAAKIAILNADHGDIFEFVSCKSKSEKMAHALINAGFDGDFRARFGVYQSVPFQNANHSVRVTDEFMQCVETNSDWNLMARDGVTVLETVKARALWNDICEAAHVCGDPGLQFDTMINQMHTVPAHGRISCSNPCSEYMSLDDSACNLASLNLRKFQNYDGTLDVDNFTHAVDVIITAMDILVDGSSYPTPKIQDNAHKFRQLGLGYTNLGAYFMAQGIPYDSDRAREQAAGITAIMCGRAYCQSAKLASVLGPFEGYEVNKSAMCKVMERHSDAVPTRASNPSDDYLFTAANYAWTDVRNLGFQYGYRNSQATVLAPTGTISFKMDADTTGIEPDLSLVKYKKVVGGSFMKIVNQGVQLALKVLGYDLTLQKEICAHMEQHGSMVGSRLKDEHLPVFDSSFPDPVGGRFLRPEAHLLMMAAVQPFISGAISKTVNAPAATSVEEIGHLYLMAWKLGLKSVALYRDGSKGSQPLQSEKSQKTVESDLTEQLKKALLELNKPHRRRLPEERKSLGHKFEIGNHEGYIHAGMYDDGDLGEVFIKMSKEGSTVSGLMDAIATLTSVSLQYGVPLEALVKKFRFAAFDPSGWTANPEIKHATSIIDYVFRWLELKFIKTVIPVVELESEEMKLAIHTDHTNGNGSKRSISTGHICPDCGHVTQRAGACFACSRCAWTGGCG